MTQHGCLVSEELYLHYCSLNAFKVVVLSCFDGPAVCATVLLIHLLQESETMSASIVIKQQT